MDTVLLLILVAGMSLIAAIYVVGDHSQTGAAKRSPRKSSRKSTSARKKPRQKATKQRKSRYNVDDDLYEMIFETMRGHGDKRR
jgi:hypothetical protein